LKGLEAFGRLCQKAGPRGQKIWNDAQILILTDIHGRAAPYPAAGPWSRTPPDKKLPRKGKQTKWYQRNWGPKWLSSKKYRWSTIGRSTKRKVEYGQWWAGVKSSQMMSKNTRAGGSVPDPRQKQDSWRMKMRDKWTAVLGSLATYAKYVIGLRQTSVHAQHGWKNAKTAVRESIRSRAPVYILRAATQKLVDEAKKEGGR